MSHPGSTRFAKVTVPGIRAKKGGQPIVALTAYDYPTARLVDEAEVDILLVGDSLGQTALGYETTLPVTVDEMISATRAVRRGSGRSLIVADMPFGSYQSSPEKALECAIRLVKEGGAEAVKLEGGAARAETIKAISSAEIPVMGHIGLTPQSVLKMGGYRVQGKSMEAVRELIEDAMAIENAGAFSIVIEGVPAEISRLITERVRIPTVGIGAGPDCDGQILVLTDLLGLSFGHTPKFVRQYADLRRTIASALARYSEDVRARRFPSDNESYHLPEGTVIDAETGEEESMPPLGPIN